MSKIIFGIDVGGTTCKCGTFSEEGELLRKEEIPTRKDEGGSLILPDISEYIKGVLADMNMTTEDVAGIGMGLPGACLEDGTVNKCINLAGEYLMQPMYCLSLQVFLLRLVMMPIWQHSENSG